MDGVVFNGIFIFDVLCYGDYGFGIFKNMVGEMIVFDGEVY